MVSIIDREYFGMRPGLERIQRFLGAHGDPQFRFPSIHIVGTNGKGSTAVMIAEIFKEAGYRVGLYTSPHLVDVRERIRINGKLISKVDFEGMDRRLGLGLLPSSQPTTHNSSPQLTYFEALAAIAFLYFAEKKVNIAVVEAGLGGPLDATNVIAPIATVMTSIGVDHAEILGKDAAAIAGEKAKVFRKGVPAFIPAGLPPDVLKTVKKVAKGRGAPLQVCGPVKDMELGLKGGFQLENAGLAVAVARKLHEKSTRNSVKKVPGTFLNSSIINGLKNVRWPGRFDVVQEDPLVILDGAHNPAAMRTLKKGVRPLFVPKKGPDPFFTVLFCVMADKDWKGMVREIAPVVDKAYCWSIGGRRALDPRKLAGAFREAGVEAECVDDLDKIFPWKKKKPLLVTGSLYAIGGICKNYFPGRFYMNI